MADQHMSIEEYRRITGQAPKIKASAKRSDLEIELAHQMMVAKLPDPIEEYRVSSDRRYRFDFAWPDLMLAVEVEGGTWTNGRHSRGAGFANDCKKYNYAQSRGWLVLRYPGEMVKSGEALEQISELIRRRSEQTPANDKKEREEE